jgi:hypothetical protein
VLKQWQHHRCHHYQSRTSLSQLPGCWLAGWACGASASPEGRHHHHDHHHHQQQQRQRYYHQQLQQQQRYHHHLLLPGLLQYRSDPRHHQQCLRWALHATKRACGGAALLREPGFVSCRFPQLAPGPALLLLVGVLSLPLLVVLSLAHLLLLYQPVQLR